MGESPKPLRRCRELHLRRSYNKRIFFNIVAQFSIIILSATYSVILFNPNLSVISFLLLYIQSVETEILGSRPPSLSLSRPTWVTKISYVMLKWIQLAS